MSEMVESVLKQALKSGRPVIIIYNGEKEMTQRRIFVRKLDGESVTAYCMLKKEVRRFKKQGILSAVIADDE